MFTRALALSLICAATAAVLPAQAQDTGWIRSLVDLGFNGTIDGIAQAHDWRVKQVSSYDPSGGNADDQHGHQVFDGGVVLADLNGPGAITRIWSRNPEGTLYVYIDDIEHPILIMPFRDMFTGDLELHSPGFNLFAPPFTGEGNGGYFSYVPIPYQQRCRLIVTGAEQGLSYQVTYAEFPQGTPLKSFELTLSNDDLSIFRDWRDAWQQASFRKYDRKTERFHSSRHKYWPETNTQVYPIEGPGTITEIELYVESIDEEMLDGAWILIFFDGQEKPAVVAPIGDFFGAATKDVGDFETMALGRKDGRMWCRYPMPFRELAEIRFVNATNQIADIRYDITWREGEVEDDYYFFARYTEDTSETGVPYRIASIEGDGHYVGSTISASHPDSWTFLEGDDQYLVDEEPAANFHGTGTDDYFNAGWHFTKGEFSAPTHATVLKQQNSPATFAAFRALITDAVPFRSSFVFDLEHGPQNDRPGVKYTSVAYWYQKDTQAKLWTIPDVQHWLDGGK